MKKKRMKPNEFVAAIRRLRITMREAAKLLDIGRSTALKYAAGYNPIPGPVARLLDMYIRCGVPQEYRE